MDFDLMEVKLRNTHFSTFYTLLSFMQVIIQAESFNIQVTEKEDFCFSCWRDESAIKSTCCIGFPALT